LAYAERSFPGKRRVSRRKGVEFHQKVVFFREKGLFFAQKGLKKGQNSGFVFTDE
jgi:hypothetical protein